MRTYRDIERAGPRTVLFPLLAWLCLSVLCWARAEADNPIRRGSGGAEAQSLDQARVQAVSRRLDLAQAAGCDRRFYTLQEGGAVRGDMIATSSDFLTVSGDTGGFRLLRIIDHEMSVGAISWGADDRLIATATAPGIAVPSMVRVWDMLSGACLAQTLLDNTTVVNARVSIGLVTSQEMVAVPARLAWPTGPNSAAMWRFRSGAGPRSALPWPGGIGEFQRFVYISIDVSSDQQQLAVVANSAQGGELECTPGVRQGT